MNEKDQPMNDRYRVSGTGHIVNQAGAVVERQSLPSPQHAVAELLSEQDEEIRRLRARLAAREHRHAGVVIESVTDEERRAAASSDDALAKAIAFGYLLGCRDTESGTQSDADEAAADALLDFIATQTSGT